MKMSQYCKAYPLARLKEFQGWDSVATMPARTSERSNAQTCKPYLFVHDNYVVTDGVFLDENVVLADPSPEWVQFCRDTLGYDRQPRS